MAIYVVFMHSHLTTFGAVRGTSLEHSSFLNAVEALCHHPGFAVRVPLFFAFSGWLFWRREIDFKEGLRKITSRARIVAFPYLLWGTLPAVVVSTLYPRLGGTLQSALLDPPSYHLWFLRHLMVVVLLTPALLPVLRNRRLGTVALAMMWVWHLAGGFPPIFAPYVRPYDLFFFGLGGYIAIHRLPVPRFSSRVLWVALPAYFAAIVGSYVFHGTQTSIFEANLALAGLVLFVGAYRPEWAIFRLPIVRAVRDVSFFVYLAHEPLLTGVRKAMVLLGGTSAPVLLAQFFLAPLVTAALLVSVARFLIAKAPRLYAALTGGRCPTRVPVPASVPRPTLVLVEGSLEPETTQGQRERIAA